MRATLADAKASRIPIALNVTPNSDAFLTYLNEATRRLMLRGKFWGTYQPMRFCVTEGCLTFPRQVASINSIAICGQPIAIRNQWFEYLPSGYGIRQPNSCNDSNSENPWGCGCGQQLIDRGTSCTFADIRGTNKKIRVYADIAESAGAKVLLQGTDANGEWIISETSPGSGVWYDGEYVAISTTPQLSTKFFSSLVAVQKPITNGPVRLYEYNTDTATQRAIAYYESDETRPSYRRAFVSGLPEKCCGECELTTINVMAQLEFIPVRSDSDWLLIGNLGALKDMCMSVLKFEANLPDEGAFYEAKAVNEMQKELRFYLGSGVTQPLKMQPRNIGGAGVVNLV